MLIKTKCVTGVWKVVFRRVAARQPFYNWELRFSVEEQQQVGGENLEQVDGGGEAVDQEAGGEIVEQLAGAEIAEQAGEGGGGGEQEEERGGASETTHGEGGDLASAQAGKGGRYEEQVGAGCQGGEQADDVAAVDEAEEEGGEGGREPENFKRWVVRLLQLEERWRKKGFQRFLN